MTVDAIFFPRASWLIGENQTRWLPNLERNFARLLNNLQYRLKALLFCTISTNIQMGYCEDLPITSK